jgi:hypothetical protein
MRTNDRVGIIVLMRPGGGFVSAYPVARNWLFPLDRRRLAFKDARFTIEIVKGAGVDRRIEQFHT